MSLNHIIIHKIARSNPGQDIDLTLADQALPAQDAVFSLYEQIKFSYLRSAQKQFGYFDNEQSSPLPGWLQQFHQQKIPFTSLTVRLVEQLKLALDNVADEAFSAHILIAVETVLENPILSLFWIQHSEGLMIDSQLAVSHSQTIETNKVHFGLRVNFSEWLDDKTPKYLSVLTTRGNKALTEAWTGYSAFSPGIDVTEDTQEFLGIVDRYAESLPADRVSDYRHQVIDYCVQKDACGAPVIFDELSASLDEQAPKAFSQFIAQQQEKPKPEIHTDRNALKRYIRFFGRDRDMSISFSADRFGKDIIYNAQNGELTLQQLPKALKAQLAQQLKKAD